MKNIDKTKKCKKNDNLKLISFRGGINAMNRALGYYRA